MAEENKGTNISVTVYGNAKVYDRAKVYGDTRVSGGVEVCDDANVNSNVDE